MNTTFRFSLILLLLISGWAMAAGETRLFRYKNDIGVVVIDDNIPPKYAKLGYEILNQWGKVVETVPPELSAEEISKLSDEEKAKRTEKEQAERELARDLQLLRRYSTVSDIEAALDRRIKELHIRLSILKANLQATKKQIERQQAQAANIERGGREVPDALKANIKELEEEIRLAEASIAARNEEIENVRADFQKDIDRFRYLIEVKGFKR